MKKRSNKSSMQIVVLFAPIIASVITTATASTIQHLDGITLTRYEKIIMFLLVDIAVHVVKISTNQDGE